ncbi:helix-turn-helix domain-containing protein [Luteococcus sp.]|uniref:helix-turn-helix domain-containing protein n=1 Tax=Luteococcus sp. TaxID=1969402 RepID=UPI0037365743
MNNEPFEVVQARADALVEALEDLKFDLVELREKRMTQKDVAERMGMSQSAVSQFERYDSNPTLTTLRRYALAVGARLRIEVVDDVEEQPVATTTSGEDFTFMDSGRDVIVTDMTGVMADA